jgi:hypothetical protein
MANESGNFVVPGKVSPVAAVECQTCGNLRFVRFEFMDRVEGVRTNANP